MLPGTTLRVIYREIIDDSVVYDLDDDFTVVAVESELSADGERTTAVHISTTDRMAMSDAEFLASQVQEATVLSTHQQLGPSVDTMPWRDEMDDSHGASFSFWTGDEYTSIQRCVLRFKIKPLRSTVKSVAGISTTSDSGGGSTSGSGGGSSQTTTGSAHDHGITLGPSTTGTPVYYNAGYFNTSGGGFLNVSNDYPAHTHSVTIPDHTHTTPDHTHTLTPNITMQYGIYEESSANTLVVGDLVIQLNGGSDLSSGVVDIGSGWYELDITDELVDSAYRPSQESNVIEITTSVAKTARIEGQLRVRGVVQAVAYS